MNDVLSLRSEIYLLLSESLKKPTADFIDEQPEIISFLSDAFTELGYEIPKTLYSSWPQTASDLDTLTAAYHQSFVYPVHTRVIPVESIYRRWTHDTTAAVPFASEKGLLMSDHALHMNTLYDAYGITIPEEYSAMPDHLCLQLEFASLLLTQETDECFRIFLDEHLSWVPELVKEAEEQSIPDFYLQVIKITAQFLAEELRRYGSLKS